MKIPSEVYLYMLLFVVVGGIIIAIKEYFRSPKFKGKMGEWALEKGLSLKLDPKVYRVFRDLKITDRRGTTQIDLVVVSPYGIFVVEVKNYNGLIYGGEREKYWTQVIGKRRIRFYNPLRQNYRHMKALSEVLQVDEKLIHPVVFFIGDAQFRTPMPGNVLNSGLSNYIKTFSAEKVLSENKVREICEKLGRFVKNG